MSKQSHSEPTSNPDLQQDMRWMRRALRLAENAMATAPNPMVGCVLVQGSEIVGEGWTQPYGQAHAERVALADAGERARGATAYVTLEPCCHWGRTPPCTDALVAAGVARVVAATQDSNPQVGGQGLAQLRQAGLTVTLGVLEKQARRGNEAFFHYHQNHTPFVTLKSAQTLDGKIATRTGSSHWITGEEARAYVHRLRAKSGAVLTSVTTLIADDARLDARLPGISLPHQPLRVIVDSQLRTPADSAAVHVAEADPLTSPLLIVTTEGADREREHRLRRIGVEVVRLPADEQGRVSLHALMRLLGQRHIISVLVEVGGEMGAALLTAGLVHKCLFFFAPKIVGGRSAPTAVEGDGIAQMEDALYLKSTRLRRFGPDYAIEGYIRESAES